MSVDHQPPDFDALTSRQIEALCNVAFGGQGAGCHPRTLKRLVELGLIEPVVTVEYEGPFRWRITKHEMPLPVHIAFCQWCSDQEGPDDDA